MMAGVLEKRERRTYLDDTTPLTVIIVTNRMRDTHVEYVIKVHRGPNPEEGWEVCHRYSDFLTLQQTLQIQGNPLPLPPKKLFGNTDRQFLVERQQGLQTFLDKIQEEPVLRNHLAFKKFVDPANYSTDFYENALRNVSMFFRSEPSWTIVNPLKDIGWRIRKQYYLIRSKGDVKLPQHLLTWSEPGPDFCLNERELEACLKVLQDIKHPFILSPVYASFNGTGLMIVRQYIPTGSLRDAIYGQQPNANLLQKYGGSSGKRVLGLTPANIAKYGRQVLEALRFLFEKGYVLGHIQPGNVILERGTAKLVDIENCLIGQPSIYRHHLLEIRKINSCVDQTVYSFGHMLYEMGAAQMCKTPTIETCPSPIPAGVAPIIMSILSPKGIKDGLPSISDLLVVSFFTTGDGVPVGEKPYIKVSSKLKEVIRRHCENSELRLREEQKKLAQQRRVSKAQESIMSEDEKKKRRKMRKKQLSLQDVDEPQSYPTTTSLPRQSTIGTSGITASASVRSKSAQSNHTPSPATTNGHSKSVSPVTNASNNNSKSKSKAFQCFTLNIEKLGGAEDEANNASVPPVIAPAAPSDSPPAPRPPANRSSNERGALLGSIEGFSKGKLKKAVTNDRSAPRL